MTFLKKVICLRLIAKVFWDIKLMKFLSVLAGMVCCGFLTACAENLSDKTAETFSVVMNLKRPKPLRYLQGKSSVEVLTQLGEPMLKRTENPYSSWVYRTNKCVLFVFFNEKKESVYTQTRGECETSLAGYDLNSSEHDSSPKG